MLEVYQALQNGLTVDYASLPPWVARGLNLFLSEMKRATRLEDAHRAAERALLGL